MFEFEFNLEITIDKQFDDLSKYFLSGMILRPHRRHMASDIFEKIIILQSNEYSKLDHENVDAIFKCCAQE